MAKEYFKKNNVEYKEIDLSIETDKIQELIQKSGQRGVPVIEIDDQVIVGFNKPELDRALGIN